MSTFYFNKRSELILPRRLPHHTFYLKVSNTKGYAYDLCMKSWCYGEDTDENRNKWSESCKDFVKWMDDDNFKNEKEDDIETQNYEEWIEE